MTEAEGLWSKSMVINDCHKARRLSYVLSCALSLSLPGCRQTHVASRAVAQPVPSPSASPSPAAIPVYAHAKPIAPTWPNSFEFVTKSLAESHDGRDLYEISAEYPQIENARSPAERRFNRWIGNKILGDAARFRSMEREKGRRDKRRKSHPPALEGLEISYVVYYSDHDLISMRLTHRVMEAGQMHPINYYETINYDLRDGRALRPRDVFRAGYLKAVSAHCRQELLRQFRNNYGDRMIEEGAAPKADNFMNWNIVPDGVLISFEDYQVGPHSMGQPELIVPYSALSGVLRVVGSKKRKCLAKANEICPS